MKKHRSLIGLCLLAAPVSAQNLEAPKADSKPQTNVKHKAEKRTVTSSGKSYIRVIHATTGAPPVDVLADGVSIASNLKFGSLSKYTEIKSGSTVIKVMESGKTAPLSEIKKSFTKDDLYTLTIYGDKIPKLMTVLDSSGKDTPDKAKVKFVHLAPSAPPVLITATKKGADESRFTKFVSSPISYGSAKSTTKKAGSQNLQVRTADGTIVKDLGTVELHENSRTTAFAIGKVGGTGETAFTVVLGKVAKP